MSFVKKTYRIQVTGTVKKAKKDEPNQKEYNKQAKIPSFYHALEKHPKSYTKYFMDADMKDESKKDKKDKKGKKDKKKRGGNVAFGNKAANLGAYVV